MDVHTEWVTYDDQRFANDRLSLNECYVPECLNGPVVVKCDLSGNDFTSMCADHALSDGWTGIALKLFELEIAACCLFVGQAFKYRENYAGIDLASSFCLVGEPSAKREGVDFVVIELTAVVDGTTRLDDIPGEPPSRLFEGKVLSTNLHMFDPGEPLFGILYPAGVASICDGDPASNYTSSRINAALIDLEIGQ